MQASEEVLEVAGGAWDASLNHYGAGGNCMVTTLQIDDRVYVVGQDDYTICKQSVDDWCGIDSSERVEEIVAETAEDAWAILRLLREDCYVWQCGACDGWMFTSNRPRVGVLRCSTCGGGGVDFRHADRHVGGEEGE